MVFGARGKPGRNFGEESTEPTYSTQIWCRIENITPPALKAEVQVLLPMHQLCSHE